jgi:hypothetical protein
MPFTMPQTVVSVLLVNRNLTGQDRPGLALGSGRHSELLM